MRFYLKEWPDDTVTLMTDTGRVIWTFDSVEGAIAGLHEWAPPVARLPGPELAGRHIAAVGEAA